MKPINFFSISFAVATLFTACSSDTNDDKIRDLDQLEGKKIVVQEGTMFETLIKEKYPNYNITIAPTFFGIYKDLVSGVAEYGIDEDVSASLLLAGGLSIDTAYTNMPPTPMAAIFNKNNTALKQQFDDFITELEQSGQLAEIRNKWFNCVSPSSLPAPIAHCTEGEPLHAVIEADYPPFNLKKGNEVSGLDAELLTLFADKINRPLKISIIPFGDLIPTIEQNKADISISGISVTDERKEHILFSKPYNQTYMLIVSLKKIK